MGVSRSSKDQNNVFNIDDFTQKEVFWRKVLSILNSVDYWIPGRDIQKIVFKHVWSLRIKCRTDLIWLITILYWVLGAISMEILYSMKQDSPEETWRISSGQRMNLHEKGIEESIVLLRLEKFQKAGCFQQFYSDK